MAADGPCRYCTEPALIALTTKTGRATNLCEKHSEVAYNTPDLGSVTRGLIRETINRAKAALKEEHGRQTN